MTEPWDVHMTAVRNHRAALRNTMNRLWGDVTVHLPHTEDDPYYHAIQQHAEDAHARLFDLLEGLGEILEQESQRRG